MRAPAARVRACFGRKVLDLRAESRKHVGGGGGTVGRPASITPVRRLKLADSVAAQLEGLIIEGTYEIGDRLPSERELAERFGVGRSSMREALRMVEAAGLLRIDHGVGVFVLRRTKNDEARSLLLLDDVTVPELFEVRRALEREAAGLAARRITAAESDALLAILDESEAEDVSNQHFVTLDAKFHRMVTQVSKNRLMERLAATIEPLFIQYSLQVIGLPDRRCTAQAGHRRIAEAIVNRRAEDARRAAIAHLRAVETDIVLHIHGGDDNSSRRNS